MCGFHIHRYLAGFQLQNDLGLRIGKMVDGFAVHAQDLVARLETGLRGNTFGIHRAHHWAQLVNTADAEADPIQQHGQQQIGEWPCGHSGDAFERMLAVERIRQVFFGHIALARVDHFNIAAQRNRCQAPIDIAPAFGIKRRAKANRKAQHFDAAQARHQQMPQFVQADQQ